VLSVVSHGTGRHAPGNECCRQQQIKETWTGRVVLEYMDHDHDHDARGPVRAGNVFVGSCGGTSYTGRVVIARFILQQQQAV